MTVILAILLAVIILILIAPLRLILSFENSDFRAKLSLAGIPVYTYKGKKDKKSMYLVLKIQYINLKKVI